MLPWKAAAVGPVLMAGCCSKRTWQIAIVTDERVDTASAAAEDQASSLPSAQLNTT